MMTAAEAIARSTSHNEIVTLPREHSLEVDLIVESEDSAENGSITEYWGTTESGSEWRVHLVSEEAPVDEPAPGAKREYIAVAGQDVGTCEALGWGTMSVEPMIIARGDDPDELLDLAVERVGHDDIEIREV
jgi:hypothetical protein